MAYISNPAYSVIGITNLPPTNFESGLNTSWVYQNPVLWDVMSPICKWAARNGRHAYCLFPLLVHILHCPLQNASSKIKFFRMSRQ